MKEGRQYDESNHEGGFWLTCEPRLELVRPGIFRTLDALVWCDYALQALVVVPRGFCSDGASLPWILTAIWDRWDPVTLKAVLLHDFGCSLHTVGTRAQVDRRFYYGLVEDDWKYARSWYTAVRLYGAYAWYLQRNVPEVDQQFKRKGST
jgi:hypothetical protein